MTDDLHSAVGSGDFARVHDILGRDPLLINDRNEYSSTPLHRIYLDHHNAEGYKIILPIVQLLLDYGADVNARNYSDCTPLHSATFWNQVERVKLLLEHGADPNVRNYDKYTPLLYAIKKRNNHIELMKLLLKYGADVNVVRWKGLTPLDTVIFRCSFDSAHILMNAGAKARNIFDFILKEHDKEDNSESWIKFLIQHGAKIDFYGKFSTRALYFAWIKMKDANYIEQVMLEQGIDVDKLKCQGEEIVELHIAAQKKNEAQVRALLESGADVNAKTVLDETPLHLLFDGVNSDQTYRIAKLLIEAGADCHVRDCFGFTPFQKAANKHFNIVNLMLANISGTEESTLKSLDISSEDLTPYSRRILYPLAVAILQNYEEVVDRLIGMGHHVEVASHANYNPPLYYAIEKGHYRITKLLFEAGCWIDKCFCHIDETRHDDSFDYICLLWEYNCNVVFKHTLIDAFRYTLLGSPSNDFTNLILFYYKIGLHSNKLKEEFVSMKPLFYLNKKLSSTLSSCDDQIEELKRDLVCGSLSKYNLLTMKMDLFVSFLNDENNLKACKEVRSSLDGKKETKYYDYPLRVRIDLAIEKRRVLDRAQDCLNEIFLDGEIYLSNEIVSNILSYLNMRELKKISIEN